MTHQDLKKLTKKVRTLRDQGLSFEKIAVALNDKGFTNLEGEAWKRGAVERFYKRRVQGTVESGLTPTVGGSKTQPSKRLQQSAALIEAVSASDGLEEVVTDLKDLLAWWRSRKVTAQAESHISLEPVQLAGPKKGAEVSINQYLLGMAKEKASQSGGRNVAALSGLMENLLWQHLGSPTHDDKGTPLVVRTRSKKTAKART